MAYDENFHRGFEKLAYTSAKAVIEVLTRLLPKPRSVLDIGCGTGVWLAAWRASGVENIVGIDGDTVNPEWLHIPKDCFHALDLTGPVHLDPPGSCHVTRGGRAHPRSLR
jgi:hypothetical protein